MRTWVISAISAASLLCFAAACKKDKPEQKAPPPGSASGAPDTTPTPVEPAKRPSQDPTALPPLPKLDLPPDPKRKEKITLGNVLFFDKRLSGANDRACYSCHLNE